MTLLNFPGSNEVTSRRNGESRALALKAYLDKASTRAPGQRILDSGFCKGGATIEFGLSVGFGDLMLDHRPDEIPRRLFLATFSASLGLRIFDCFAPLWQHAAWPPPAHVKAVQGVAKSQ